MFWHTQLLLPTFLLWSLKERLEWNNIHLFFFLLNFTYSFHLIHFSWFSLCSMWKTHIHLKLEVLKPVLNRTTTWATVSFIHFNCLLALQFSTTCSQAISGKLEKSLFFFLPLAGMIMSRHELCTDPWPSITLSWLTICSAHTHSPKQCLRGISYRHKPGSAQWPQDQKVKSLFYLAADTAQMVTEVFATIYLSESNLKLMKLLIFFSSLFSLYLIGFSLRNKNM